MRSPTSSPTSTGHITAGAGGGRPAGGHGTGVSVMLVNNETGCRLSRGGDRPGVLKERRSRALLHYRRRAGLSEGPLRPGGTLGRGSDQPLRPQDRRPQGHRRSVCPAPDLRNLQPLLAGGGQEEGLRSGTEATAQIAGFAKAVELRQEGLEEKLAHMAEIKAYCREQLPTIPGVVPVGGGEAPHILAVSLVG